MNKVLTRWRRCLSLRAGSALSSRSLGSATNTTILRVPPAVSYLPSTRWDGPLRILGSKKDAKHAVNEILDSGETILGFDVETKPNFKPGQEHKPALIQLATSSTVYLFRIRRNGHLLHPLLPILTNPAVVKTGVAVEDDIYQLQRLGDFHAAGFVCSRKLAMEQLGLEGGIKSLAAHFLQKNIDKRKIVVESNWDAGRLSKKQITYAATDAWLSREIYIQIQARIDTHAPPTVSDSSQSYDYFDDDDDYEEEDEYDFNEDFSQSCVVSNDGGDNYDNDDYYYYDDD